MSRLVSDMAAIRDAAAPAMPTLHRELARVVDAARPVGADVWALPTPEEVEVADASYYGDGRIAILVILVSALHPDFAPAIETADGCFVQVLNGT